MRIDAEQSLEDRLRADGVTRTTRISTVRLTEIRDGYPTVTLTFDSWEPITVERVTVAAPNVTTEMLHTVAEDLPSLLAVALQATALRSDGRVVRSVATTGRKGQETADAARVYREAVAAGTSPLTAVMGELNLSKPTASRRIRAAKDLGLLPERMWQL